MFRKIISYILVIAIAVTFMPARQISAAEKNAEKHVGAEALQELEYQADGLYYDYDRVKVIIQIDDQYMKDRYGLQGSDPRTFKNDKAAKKQIEYSESSRKILIDTMKKEGINFEQTQTYDMIYSGIAAIMTYKDAKAAAKLEMVKRVEIAVRREEPVMRKMLENAYYPRDNSSNPIVKADKAWLKNYEGKGQVIAVIDSGFDIHHPEFQDFDKTGAKYDQNSIKAVIEAKKVTKGDFGSSKFPFVFNYADPTNRGVKEEGTDPASHGQHVAGIIGANGKKIKGVAPKAQLLGMRVFGGIFGNGTDASIYNRAIDDAIKLEVDAINMSLGKAAGAEKTSDATTRLALENAKKAGIVVAIAAGNDHFSGHRKKGPKAEHPDYGMLGEPAVFADSLAVASMENDIAMSKPMTVEASGADKPELNFKFAPTVDDQGKVGEKNKTLKEDFVEIVDVGMGYDDEYTNKTVKDKYVLIKRGNRPGEESFTFDKKVEKAWIEDAIGVVFHDNVKDESIAGAVVTKGYIPSVMISQDDGAKLAERIKSGTCKVKFANEYKEFPNENKGKVSAFSSWGLTAEGNLKPDIMAPGGAVYSTFNDGGYGSLNGTSMASPHVAAGIAIVKQRVEADFPQLNTSDSETGMTEKYRCIKNLMMSSAVPHVDAEKNRYTSPRKQGAGNMDLERAVTGNVTLEGTNGFSSITAGNVNSNTVTLKFKIHNYGNQKETFTYKAQMNTDEVVDGHITRKPLAVAETDEKTIEIDKQQSKEVSVEISYNNHEELLKDRKNGYFLDGFVVFTNTDPLKSISIPFVAFRGSLIQTPIMEKDVYSLKEENKEPIYFDDIKSDYKPFTHVTTMVNNDKTVVLGEKEVKDATGETKYEYDKNLIAISPNGDGQAENISISVTFLRNYRDFGFKIYSAEDAGRTKVLGGVQDHTAGSKNYKNSNPALRTQVTENRAWSWSSQKVPEGKYVLVAKVYGENTGGEESPQTMEIPFMIDKTYPLLQKASYDKASGDFKLEKIVEEGSKLKSVSIKIKDKIYPADENNKVIKLPANTEIGDDDIIAITDNAYNSTVLKVKDALAREDFREIRVVPRASFEEIESTEISWEVYDRDKNKVDISKLKPGKYTVKVTKVPKHTVVADGGEYDIEIKDDVYIKYVPVKLRSLEEKEMTVKVTADSSVTFALALSDIKTGEKFKLVKDPNTGNFTGKVPYGFYKLEPENVTKPSDGYRVYYPDGQYAIINEETDASKPSCFINVAKIEPKKGVKVIVNRNGCPGNIKIDLEARDENMSKVSLEIPEGQDEGTVDLENLFYDIKGVSLANEDWSADKATYDAAAKDAGDITLKMRKLDVPDINLEFLKDKLKEAESLKPEEYTAESYKYLEIMIFATKKVLKDGNLSQDDADAFYDALDRGIRWLEPKDKAKHPVYKGELKIIIEKAKTKNKEDYEEISWKRFEMALKKAEELDKSDDIAKQEIVQQAIRTLERAMKYLKPKNEKKIEEPEKPVIPVPNPGKNPGIIIIPTPAPTPADKKDEKTKQDSKDGVKQETKIQTTRYIKGFSDGTFRPDTEISKSEVAVLLHRIIGETTAVSQAKFSDVTADAWDSAAIFALADKGVVSGTSDGKFEGSKKITRAEFVKMIAALMNLDKKVSDFADVPTGHWASGYIGAAASKGWVKGVTAGKFAPDRAISRAEAVVIINRVVASADVKDTSKVELMKFADLSKDFWAYDEIMKAVMQ